MKTKDGKAEEKAKEKEDSRNATSEVLKSKKNMKKRNKKWILKTMT